MTKWNGMGEGNGLERMGVIVNYRVKISAKKIGEKSVFFETVVFQDFIIASYIINEGRSGLSTWKYEFSYDY